MQVIRGLSKRGWYDIAADILDSCEEQIDLTNMMQDTRLPYHRLEEFLGILMYAGLVKCSSEDKLCKITNRGSEFLARYRDLEKLLRS